MTTQRKTLLIALQAYARDNRDLCPRLKRVGERAVRALMKKELYQGFHYGISFFSLTREEQEVYNVLKHKRIGF